MVVDWSTQLMWDTNYQEFFYRLWEGNKPVGAIWKDSAVWFTEDEIEFNKNLIENAPRLLEYVKEFLHIFNFCLICHYSDNDILDRQSHTKECPLSKLL